MNTRLLRTFVAVTVPKSLLTTRDMLKTTVHHKKDNLKWVRDGLVHLTLKFIGHTPPDGIEDIHNILSAVSQRHGSMQHEIAETGCFPVPSRPRVLWVGIKGNFDPLAALVKDINDALDPLGYPAEEKPFMPHITLARIKYPPKITPDVTQYLQTRFEPIPFWVDKYMLMSSELKPSGAVYSNIHEYRLNDKIDC